MNHFLTRMSPMMNDYEESKKMDEGTKVYPVPRIVLFSGTMKNKKNQHKYK